MNAVRRSVRPKHQVLIEKCYPRYQKNAAEARPNSSELSYLLFYASTRKSKLQKVGDFLEKRTVKDVWKARIGNVQVTLHILKALIEKCPRDLSLYASAVLRILHAILRSDDVTMVEGTVPTFGTFCAHQDVAMLGANQDYMDRWDEIVRQYASFASKDARARDADHRSVPVAFRLRKAGLEAIRSVASADAINPETGKQLPVVIPAILENMHDARGAAYLRTLQARESERQEAERETTAFKRRQSISTVRTMETAEADPVAASGTTEDADKLAEEETGLIAMRSLRQVFTVVNRAQLRLATAPVLAFAVDGLQRRGSVDGSGDTAVAAHWATALFEMVCGWAPVQDRYIILVTTMETLVRSPIVEEDLERQLLLAMIVRWLLASEVNLIGLSVMDVLVGLIQHILLLLQLGGHGTAIAPHHQQADAVEPRAEGHGRTDAHAASDVVLEVVRSASPVRVRLLDTMQSCIGSLATHVYYADQVSDMVSAVLLRLKPNPLLGPPSTAAAIQDPVAAAEAVASAVSLREKPSIDGFFSFDTARVRALAAVRNVLVVANARASDGSASAVDRARVPLSVWEGTQWLLRDASGDVRTAYVAALLGWMDHEVGKADFRLHENREGRPGGRDERSRGGTVARRAVSNASRRTRSPERANSAFLTLLHLAIYEHAHHYAGSESDVLLLHLLCARLVDKLGINAARSGLPMMMRLQDDIPTIDNPNAKIHLGSLVYGYLWALGATFDFETTAVGRQIHGEIARRNQRGLWLGTITWPPLALSQFKAPSPSPRVAAVSPEVFRHEGLRPFDNRSDLITAISVGYTSALASPPSSPPASPVRSFAVPIMTSQGASAPPHRGQPAPAPPQLSASAKEDLAAAWSKSEVIAATTKRSSRSASASGTGSGARAFLTVAGPDGVENGHASHSPHRANLPGHRPRPPSAAYGLVGATYGAGPLAGAETWEADVTVLAPSHDPAAHGSPHRASATVTAISTSSVRSTVRVDDLKRVLSGKSSARPRPPTGVVNGSVDGESESLVSGHFSESSDEGTPSRRARRTETTETRRGRPTRSVEAGDTPKATPTIVQPGAGEGDDDGIPSVPPLPASIRLSLPPGAHPSPFPSMYLARSRSPSSTGTRNQSDEGAGWGAVNLGQLLETVEIEGAEGGSAARPPY